MPAGSDHGQLWVRRIVRFGIVRFGIIRIQQHHGYTPSSSGTVEFATFKPGAGKNKKPTSGSGGTPTKSGTKVTKTTPSVTVTVVVPSTTRSSPSGGGSSAAKTSSTPTTTTTATPSPSSLASAQAAVYSAQAAVHTAETAVNDTKLYAPTSGTIASLSSLTPGDAVSGGGSSSGSSSSSSSSSSGSSGAAATGGAATAGSLGGSGSSSSGSSSGFAEIVNTNSLTMTVAFSESDISKVKVGQPATVTLDALAGVELAAHISSISLVGTTSSSVVSYDATLTLDQNDSRVKPGMSASASVITGQASGVTVPNAAVTGTGSLGTVNLMKNGKEVSQQVVVGLRGDSRTQIISGVSAGDQLVITIALPSLQLDLDQRLERRQRHAGRRRARRLGRRRAGRRRRRVLPRRRRRSSVPGRRLMPFGQRRVAVARAQRVLRAKREQNPAREPRRRHRPRGDPHPGSARATRR